MRRAYDAPPDDGLRPAAAAVAPPAAIAPAPPAPPPPSPSSAPSLTRPRDARLAAWTAAALFAVGAALLATAALPQPHPPSSIAVGVIGAVAVIAAAALALLAARKRATLGQVYPFAFVAVGLIAALVATSGGAQSPYSQLYVFAIVHVAAFQSRRRAVAAVAAAIVAYLVPAAYGHPGDAFLEAALLWVPLAIVAAATIGAAVHLQRKQRIALAELEAGARRLAERDALTGLGNYRLFRRQLAAEVARSLRYGDPFSLVVLDLDGFKVVNDELGHHVGDEALRRVAAVLGAVLRGEDVCCRQGGDEFAVIAVRAGEQEAHELTERLVGAVAKVELGGHGAGQLTARAGSATFGRPATRAEALIAAADVALREAKGARPTTTPPPSASPSGANGRAGRPRLAALGELARALGGARDELAIAEIAVAHLAAALDGGVSAVVRRETPAPRLRVVAATGSPAGRRQLEPLAAQGALPPERWLDAAVEVAGAPWGILICEPAAGTSFGATDRALAEAMAIEIGRALGLTEVFVALARSSFGELYRLAAALQAPHADDWRVAELAWQVGRRLHLPAHDQRVLYLAGLFHDVGAVGVPAELGLKPGELDDEEQALMRQHALIGERLLRGMPLLCEAASLVRHGHERYDGGGYPDGLANNSIPLGSRILLACDAFVAITSPRPWRAARAAGEARTELRRCAGGQLDPAVVATLLSVVG